MSVRFRFLKKNGEYSPSVEHGCFGTLMSHNHVFNHNDVNYKTSDYDYILYYQYPCEMNKNEVFIKTLRKDTAFKLKLWREVVKKFPWMKKVITVSYVNDKSIKDSFSPDKYTLIAKVNLDNPGDTIWFCLNLFRLITRSSIVNGIITQKYETPLQKVYEILGDAWETVLFAYGFGLSRVTNILGVTTYHISNNVISSTCLTDLNHIPKEQSLLFKEDPINFLNKHDNVKTSKGLHGFRGKSNRDGYFISNYFKSKEDYFTRYSNNSHGYTAIFKTEDVISELFGKDILEKVLKVFEIRQFVKNSIHKEAY